MTIVATDGRTIAADSLALCGDERLLRPISKLRTVGGKLYGVAGPMGMIDTLVGWHMDGAKIPDVPSAPDGWSLLVVDGGSISLLTSESPHAILDYATGAMLHGASAEEAAQIACRICSTCGGPVEVLEIGSGIARVLTLRKAGRMRGEQ